MLGSGSRHTPVKSWRRLSPAAFTLPSRRCRCNVSYCCMPSYPCPAGGDIRRQSGGWQGEKGGEMSVDKPGEAAPCRADKQGRRSCSPPPRCPDVACCGRPPAPLCTLCVAPCPAGQHVLERTSVLIHPDGAVEARFTGECCRLPRVCICMGCDQPRQPCAKKDRHQRAPLLGVAASGPPKPHPLVPPALPAPPARSGAAGARAHCAWAVGRVHPPAKPAAVRRAEQPLQPLASACLPCRCCMPCVPRMQCPLHATHAPCLACAVGWVA